MRERVLEGVARRSKKRVEYEHGSAHVGQCVMRHACEDPGVSGTAQAAQAAQFEAARRQKNMRTEKKIFEV